MATETLTIALDGGDISGSGYIAGDKDDTQYVTLTDGGNLSSFEIKSFGKDSPTESGDGPGGDDEFYIDLTGFNDDFDVEVRSMDAGDTFYVSGAISWSNVGNVYTINYIGSDSQVHQMEIDLESTNGTGIASISLTCFTKGTKIVTEFGKVAVESLKCGDRVMCGDGQLRPIRWLAHRHVSSAEMLENPEFRPIRIRKHALGENQPSADLVISPQHRILLNDWRAELLFGETEVLVPAVHLTDDDNITRDYQATDVTYYHFMFDAHQTVWSNGLKTESFYPGDTALEGVATDAKAELFQLFPELQTDPQVYGTTCHPTLKAYEALAMTGI